MDLWSVIVYGRTKKADYRLLAIPDDFGEEEKNWALKYIHGTTVYPERLRENPRWSLFKNHKHCVFGVTCMVRELIGSERKYEYMTKDASGRSLYIFVGYVAQINKYNFNSLKILPGLENFEFFKPEYLLISLKKSWHLKDYQIINRKIDEYPYNLELNYSKMTESIGHIDLSNKSIPPNFLPCLEGENQAFVCPDNPYNRQNLWENCCKFFDYPHKYIPLSLCLSLPQKKDVLEGPFLNATTSDTTQHLKLPKRKLKVLNEPSKIREPDNKYPSNDTDIKYPSNDTDIKRLLSSYRWGYLIGFFLILTVTFLIFLVTRKNILAIVMSLLISFYLGKTSDTIHHLKLPKRKSNRRRLPIRMILLISILIGLILLVIWKKYTLAIQIFMTLLVSLYVQHVSGK